MIGARGRGANLEPQVMNKLQWVLDFAFGNSQPERASQEPNEFTIQRQRAFEETARKIEALRQARLSCQRDATQNVH
jgi:hypothetical protein